MKQQNKTGITFAMLIGFSLISASAFAETDNSWYNELDRVTNNQKSTLSDTTISSNVKAALSATPGIDNDSLSVRTELGHVYLSGFIKSKEQETQILNIISKMEGVKGVDSSANIK